MARHPCPILAVRTDTKTKLPFTLVQWNHGELLLGYDLNDKKSYIHRVGGHFYFTVYTEAIGAGLIFHVYRVGMAPHWDCRLCVYWSRISVWEVLIIPMLFLRPYPWGYSVCGEGLSSLGQLRLFLGHFLHQYLKRFECYKSINVQFA